MLGKIEKNKQNENKDEKENNTFQLNGKNAQQRPTSHGNLHYSTLYIKAFHRLESE